MRSSEFTATRDCLPFHFNGSWDSNVGYGCDSGRWMCGRVSPVARLRTWHCMEETSVVVRAAC